MPVNLKPFEAGKQVKPAHGAGKGLKITIMVKTVQDRAEEIAFRSTEMPAIGGTNVINVGKLERMVSIGMGIGLISSSVKNKGFFNCLFLMMSGGYMLYRGVTGNCPVSSRLSGRDERSTSAGTAALINIGTTFIIDKPRSQVYASWRKLENLPRFMKHLKSIEEKDSKLSHWKAKIPGDIATLTWDTEITNEEEGSLIAWCSVPGSPIENAGEVRFEDVSGGPGTEVQVSISYRPPAGNLGEGIARLLNPFFEDMVREDVRNFKQFMEGKPIRPEAAQ